MSWTAWTAGGPGASPPPFRTAAATTSWASSPRSMWGEALADVAAATRGLGMNRILVVDNEPDLRHTYDRLLRRQGYRVITAGSRAAGLRLVTQPPPLVVADPQLPGGRGLDIVRAASAHPPPVPAPVGTPFASPRPRE